MNPPDVTVIVPVYNTMPYLTRCLDSLVSQTIGTQRLHVVAVNDGSTDGSGEELDGFARRHPGLFTVIHQANSGGPAGPCNRGIDVATGRYVFFLGADDFLGREALRRLVDAADKHGSDVVLGKVIGVHSRSIYQDIFVRDNPDIDLFNSSLPRSLANTKLFRREMLERHAIRYDEGLPLGSDLPFTLEACVRSRRTSVLTGYDFYFAVRRLGGGNITTGSRHLDRLRFVQTVMKFVADLIEPGPRRDAVLAHRFDHEVSKLVEDDLLRLDPETQLTVQEGVGQVVAEYLTPEINARLAPETRIRLALACDGRLDDLLAVIRQDAHLGVPTTVIENGRRFAAYPGFRDPTRNLPDACFEVTDAADWSAKLDAASVAWRSGMLVITARTPAPDLRFDRISVGAEEIRAYVQLLAQDHSGTTLRITIDVARLLGTSDPTGQRRNVSAQPGPYSVDLALGAAGAAGATAVRAPRLQRVRPSIRWRRLRPYLVAVVKDTSGRLVISVVPVTLGRILARVRAISGVWPDWTGRSTRR